MSEANTNLFSQESSAPTAGPLIPAKTLAWVGLHVRGLKNTKTDGGLYADIELTVVQGPFEKRKIWIMICDPYDQRNSEGWRKMAVSAMTRIFESAKIFIVGDPASYQRFAGKPFQEIAQALDGICAACEIKVAKSDGYPDKNDIAEWLSPNPVSGSVKKFTALINPEQASDAARGEFLKVPTGPAWAQTVAPAAPTPAAEAAPATVAAPAAPAQAEAAPAAAGWNPPAAPAAGAPAGVPGTKPAWMQ